MMEKNSSTVEEMGRTIRLVVSASLDFEMEKKKKKRTQRLDTKLSLMSELS